MKEKPFQPKMAWRMTILLALFMPLNFVDKIVVGLVAVPVMTEFKLSPTEFGVIGGSFFWPFAVAGVIGGFLVIAGLVGLALFHPTNSAQRIHGATTAYAR